MQDLKELARQYAAKKPDWLRPGMAFMDYGPGADSGGDQWRAMPSSWVAFSRGNDARIEHVSQHREAIANGPDLDDKATLGAMLLVLPDAQLCRRTSWTADGTPHPYVWAGSVDEHGNGEIGNDAAEAIIRAALAALGE